MYQLSEVASQENVTGVPAFKFYKAGQSLDSLGGADSKLSMVERMINKYYNASVTESSLVNLRSAASYKQAIAENKLVVVVFSASWCGPCQAIAPKVVEFAGKYTDAAFFKVYFIYWIGAVLDLSRWKIVLHS